MKYVQQPSSGLPTQLPLDFSVRTTEGTVVPQRRWSLVNEVDIRLHVQGAALQLPVFFVDRNGGVGFWLPDILEGRDLGLYNRDIQAPLGGKTTTHIRIDVSSLSYLGAKYFIHVRRLLSKWPGYAYWQHQILIRDETYSRNPITVGRFMKRVGTLVNKFINVSFLLLLLSSVVNQALPPLGLLNE